MFEGRFIFEWLDDGVNMQLQNDLSYTTKDGLKITIKTGERTDGASIPRILWSAEGSPFTGLYRKAAVLHDYLYRNGYGKNPIVDRKKADKIFYEAMLELGVGKFEAQKKYWAVRILGPKW